MAPPGRQTLDMLSAHFADPDLSALLNTPEAPPRPAPPMTFREPIGSGHLIRQGARAIGGSPTNGRGAPMRLPRRHVAEDSRITLNGGNVTSKDKTGADVTGLLPVPVGRTSLTDPTPPTPKPSRRHSTTGTTTPKRRT